MMKIYLGDMRLVIDSTPVFLSRSLVDLSFFDTQMSPLLIAVLFTKTFLTEKQ